MKMKFDLQMTRAQNGPWDEDIVWRGTKVWLQIRRIHCCVVFNYEETTVCPTGPHMAASRPQRERVYSSTDLLGFLKLLVSTHMCLGTPLGGTCGHKATEAPKGLHRS